MDKNFFLLSQPLYEAGRLYEPSLSSPGNRSFDHPSGVEDQTGLPGWNFEDVELAVEPCVDQDLKRILEATKGELDYWPA